MRINAKTETATIRFIIRDPPIGLIIYSFS